MWTAEREQRGGSLVSSPGQFMGSGALYAAKCPKGAGALSRVPRDRRKLAGEVRKVPHAVPWVARLTGSA